MTGKNYLRQLGDELLFQRRVSWNYGQIGFQLLAGLIVLELKKILSIQMIQIGIVGW